MIFPNPVHDQFFMKDHENVKVIRIYNTQGQQMISVEMPGCPISILSPGLHVAVIEKLNAPVIKDKLVNEINR